MKLMPCPHCGKKLMLLPPNYPLYEVQCTGCSFRAQVKSQSCAPRDQVFGAGWDILEKVLKSGFMIPPLIVNHNWKTESGSNHEIHFYPFIPRRNLRKRQLSAEAQRANYRMFNYLGLRKLPHFVVYSTGPSASK